MARYFLRIKRIPDTHFFQVVTLKTARKQKRRWSESLQKKSEERPPSRHSIENFIRAYKEANEP